jgi:hypothetical protein
VIQDLPAFREYNYKLDREAERCLQALGPDLWRDEVRDALIQHDFEEGSLLRDYFDRIWTGNFEGLTNARRLLGVCGFDIEPRPNAVDLRLAFARVKNGGSPATELEVRIAKLLITRRDRWQILADMLGTTIPDEFTLWRGVNNSRRDYVSDVYRAWKDDLPLKLIHRELTSWTTERSVAERFASGYGHDQTGAVVVRAQIPFVDTVADKWVDDGAFIVPWYAQNEVLVGTATPNSIIAIREDVIVWWRGVQYTYDERDEFFAAWQATNSPIDGIYRSVEVAPNADRQRGT